MWQIKIFTEPTFLKLQIAANTWLESFGSDKTKVTPVTHCNGLYTIVIYYYM